MCALGPGIPVFGGTCGSDTETPAQLVTEAFTVQSNCLQVTLYHVCVYRCIHVYRYICIHVCMYVCIYVYMYICVYVYIYI
jgi:hypothetical protein